MLEVYFCNVGDGDAILLIERRSPKQDYVVLVDAGRPFVDLQNGSRRKEAIYYLKAYGVKKIDRMILTHPHIDHIGGAERILHIVPTKRLTMLIVPPEDAAWVSPSFRDTDKVQNGMRHLLNVLDDVTRTARRTGCIVDEAEAGEEPLTERLTMTTYLPHTDVLLRQRAAYAQLYGGGKAVNEPLIYAAAKERNQASLMVRFDYAGRSVLLTGDRYGFDWEDDGVAPCDVLKLPHHGDGKSVTKKVLKQLRPSVAVVSCQSDPREGKDRPNAEVLAMTQQLVQRVFCTETRKMPTMAPFTSNAICVRISDDGDMDSGAV